MKKAKKALLLALCAVLLVGASVAGTLAYLTDDATVTNTFTVGSVDITLLESEVNVYGEKVENANPVTENSYKLIPGHEYTKDPVITVTEGSEKCYLFVKIQNGISDIEDSSGNTIAKQMENNGWTALTGVENVYYYGTEEESTIVDASETAQTVSTFTTFKVAEGADLSGYGDTENPKTIVVTAYAVQADGFTSAQAAWNAASSSFNTTTES